MPFSRLLHRFLKREAKPPLYETRLELVPLFDYFTHSTAPVQGDWKENVFYCHQCDQATPFPEEQSFGYCKGCMSLIEKPSLGTLSKKQQREKEYYESVVLSNRLDLV